MPANFMTSFAAAPLRRNGIALLVSVVLGSNAATSLAGTVPGGSHTVNSGDAVEAWLVRSNATLNVARDGTTLDIEAEPGAMINLTGALVEGTLHLTNAGSTIVESVVSSTNGAGLSMTRLAGSAAGSSATAERSQFSGIGSGVSVSSGASLRLMESTAEGFTNDFRGVGIRTFGGSIEALQGTAIRGETTGIDVLMSDAGDSYAPNGNIIIDASRVIGIAGSAISVQADRPDSTLRETNIVARNGAQLVGGDGNLLSVLNSRVSPTDKSSARLQVETTTLAGNVVAEEFAEAHVTLMNGGRINGRFDNVTTANILDGGYWQLAGDSEVGQLALAAGGILALGEGAAFNTLAVTGDYSGSGGTLLFNTVLGDDTAASDKLIINGSTSGHTNVAINNVGGIGAQTVNGIQLIQVDGASNGEFNLAGRAVGGQYEYFLFKGGKADPNDGGWYLRSELPTAPDPCDADPTLPGCTPVVPPDPDPCLADPDAPDCVITLPEQCLIDPSLPQCLPPVPVLRPEPGAYLANQSAATQMFGVQMHDRNGGTARGLSERGAWARVSRSQADYGVIGDQLSVNGNTDVLQLGTDIFAWGEGSRGQLGVMLGNGRANNTVTSRLTGYSAKGKVEGQALGIYGTWLQDTAATTGLYVDAWANHAQYKNSVQGDGLAKERYDSRATTASVEAGYGFQVADSERVALFVEPQLQLGYTDFKADRHVEANGTLIGGSDADGLTSRMGVRFFGHANTEVGNRVQPFVAVNWIRESSDNSLRFDGARAAGGLPHDRYEAKAGATLQLGGRWTAWGNFGLQRGDGGYRNVTGQIGLRASW